MTRRSARRGFTIVELLIAATLIALIGAAVSFAFVGSRRVAIQTDSIGRAQNQARLAITQIEQEVRAGYASSLDGADLLNDILTFQTLPPNSTAPVAISYEVDGGGNLVRHQGTDNRIVARSVDRFELTAATADSVAFVLVIDVNGQSAVLATTVAFRNP